METPQSTRPASRETCLGLSLVEERSISEEERAALQREARQTLGRSCAWGCSARFVFFIFLCIIASVFPNNNDASAVASTLSVIFMVLGLAAVATFFLLVKDKYKLRKIAKRDLRNGNIKRYQSFAPGIDKDNLPETNVPPEPTGKIAGVDVSAYEPIILEVFRESRRLWQVNGTRVKKLVFLPEEHTAFQPEQAKIAAKWVEPAPVIAKNVIDISQSVRRELSEEESSEIYKHIRKTIVLPSVVAIGLTLFSVGPVVLYRMYDMPIHLEFGAYFLFAMTILADISFVYLARSSCCLRKDAKKRDVIIIRYPDWINEEEEIKGAVIEWLPHSKLNWTINGEPAQWRLRG